MQTNREEFLQEIKLRKLVREHISVVMKEEEEILKEENQLRSIVRKLILEQGEYKPTTTAEAAADRALEATTTQVYDEVSLLMEPEEKQSFEDHFLKYLNDFFEEQDTQEPNKLREQEEINISVQNDDEPETGPAMIPPEDERPSKEELEDEEKKIPGKEYEGADFTGKEYADRAWKSVEKQIGNYYSPLTGETRQKFKDLMIANYQQYLQNWMSDESEVAPI